jgi:hypothetical protein
MLRRNISLVLALTLLAALAVPAIAQDTTTTKKEPSAAQKAQQQKMTDCNKQASDKQLKGDDRKKFMSTCLSGSPTAATATKPMTQQEKMTDCNNKASAKSLKGDERKTFMSTCLSGSTK